MTAPTTEVVEQCIQCEKDITGTPLVNDQEVFWMGRANATTWCSEECALDHAEFQPDPTPGPGDTPYYQRTPYIDSDTGRWTR